MIKSRRQLKECLAYERKLYMDNKWFSKIKLWLLRDSEYLLWHYVKMLRYTEFHYNSNNRLRYFLYQRRKNKEGVRLGISIYHNSFDAGLRIYHYGSIIINSQSRIGKNCKLHGENCIGNKGESTPYDVPILGDNVDMGIGSKIIGKVVVASDVTVGANAVIVNDILEPGVTVVGIPAKLIC